MTSQDRSDAKRYLLNGYAVADAECATLGSTMASSFGHAKVAVKVMVVELLDALPLGLGRPLIESKAKTLGWAP